MSLRTAVRQSTILTFVVLGAFLWLLIGMLDVIRDTDVLAVFAGDYVGQSAAGGLFGALVLAVLLVLLVTLYSEITEEDPAPETWPPTE